MAMGDYSPPTETTAEPPIELLNDLTATDPSVQAPMAVYINLANSKTHMHEHSHAHIQAHVRTTWVLHAHVRMRKSTHALFARTHVSTNARTHARKRTLA